jgi:hypothetical protein
MSNSMNFTENNSEIDNHEEEKDPLRFDTIESIKRGNESFFIPEYNIKKDRLESMNLSIFDKNNNKSDKNNFNVNYHFNNNINNNVQNLDESINQSSMSFQDLPLFNHNNLNNKKSNSNIKNIHNHSQRNSKFDSKDFNTEPFLEVEDAGEKKDM